VGSNPMGGFRLIGDRTLAQVEQNE
jgi:hypothetical protein